MSFFFWSEIAASAHFLPPNTVQNDTLQHNGWKWNSFVSDWINSLAFLTWHSVLFRPLFPLLPSLRPCCASFLVFFVFVFFCFCFVWWTFHQHRIEQIVHGRTGIFGTDNWKLDHLFIFCPSEIYVCVSAGCFIILQQISCVQSGTITLLLLKRKTMSNSHSTKCWQFWALKTVKRKNQIRVEEKPTKGVRWGWKGSHSLFS